ncbi:DUF4283 domain-containing protein [Citrus sinensis]|uniref:DUF4283 domain-containing protein n=1 Tax=Citrus sinensis TaxID=2711 RepID=A0ACB8M925_CITSI|nr:DUF4283 domain-containing protein [Citrus sinensis]
MNENSENLGGGGNPNFGEAFPLPFREARTTKKARFCDEENDSETTKQVSYKETLVNSSQTMENGFGGGAVDWDLEEGDVIERNDGTLPSISFSDRIHAKLSEPWKHSVVVKLLGRNIGYKTLCTRLHALWRTTMTYSPWSPSFDFTKTVLNQVIVWIRLPGLAVHLYNHKVLQKLGQMVGTVIKIDSNIASSARGRFTRLAVSVSLDKPLVSQFELDGRIQKVEYEGLPVICFACGRYSHNSSNCKISAAERNSDNVAQPPAGVQSREDPTSPEANREDAAMVEPFGPWMITPKSAASKPPNRKPFTPMNPTRNPFQTTALHIREKTIISTPHDNPSQIHCPITHAAPNNQQTPHVATTLDPTKHTVVFCSSQILPYGDMKGVGTDHRDREDLDPQPLADPPDDHHVFTVNAFEHAYTHPVVPMSGDDGKEMSDEEFSMVQESPLVMMDDIHDQ